MNNLSKNDITYLESVGFNSDRNKYDGNYFIDIQSITILLKPTIDKKYKLNFIEWCYDLDFPGKISEDNQTLKEFIEQNLKI